MLIKHLVSFLLLTLLFSIESHAKETIIINEDQLYDFKHQYTQELLIAALDKTINTYGEYEIKALINVNSTETQRLMSKKNFGDVIQGATRPEWEQNLITVPIPIFKGMLGLRVLIINKDMQANFLKIQTIEQLKSYLLGTVDRWSITKVFEYNQFNHVKIKRHSSIFDMLAKKRFDYLARGLHEVAFEYDKYREKTPSLHIEESILLNTQLPGYFFANPHNPLLAERIETGLKMLIKDGSFETIFNKHYSKILVDLNLPNRKIFHLKNPDYKTLKNASFPKNIIDMN